MKKLNLPELDWQKINSLIDMALEEDIKTGDATSISVIPENVTTEARFVTREKCVCAGLEVAKTVFLKIDDTVAWTSLVKDGDILEPGDVLASVKGNARLTYRGKNCS